MAGYTRQSAAEIASNLTVTASAHNNEYNALAAAFDSADGHTHDGTIGGGGRITTLGPAGQITLSSAAFLPATNNSYDIGSTSLRFKDAYFAGGITAGSLSLTTSLPIASGGTGSATAAGARTALGLGSAAVANNTDGLTEGSTNQYFTNARARSAVSASGSLTYNSSTGVFSFTDAVTSVAGKTGAVSLVSGDIGGLGSVATANNTDGVSEGSTNLYFTNARARSALSASGSLSYNSSTGAFSFTDAVTSVAGKTGAVSLSAGDISGLGSAATANNTDGVSEGSTNQYFTNARARSAVSVSGLLGYNSSTGVISLSSVPAANVSGLSDTNTRVAVSRNGVAVGTRRRINLIEGSNVTLTVADDSGNEEVDVTIALAGGVGNGTVTSVGLTGSDFTITGSPITTNGSIGIALNTVPVAKGGTGSTTASGARTALGVAIGTDVQAYSSNLAAFAAKTAPSGTVVGTTDTQTISNKTISSPDITGSYRAGIVAVSALDIDCSAGNYFTKTISANSTFTFSNVPSSRAFSFTLELTHTSGTVTWPSTVRWPGGVTPSLTTGKTHLFVFVTDDGGARWRASSVINYDN